MKKIIVLIAAFCSFNLLAGEVLSNQQCIDVYRTGYLNLEHSVLRFNDESYNRFELAADVSANSSVVGVVRAACLAVENPSVEKCVVAYKDLYKDLREQVKLGAIIMGNQKKIAYSKKMQQVIEREEREVENTSLLGKLSRALRIGVATISETIEVTKDITALEFIDAKCGN
jgi:hypothetical protein